MKMHLPLAAIVASHFLTTPCRAANVPNVVEADLYRIEVAADKDFAVYRVGEPIVFHIGVYKDKQLANGVELAYQLNGDGNFEKEGSIVCKNGVARLQTKLKRPGFLLLTVTKKEGAGTGKNGDNPPVAIRAGAAVEPGKIKVSRPVPEDFDEFWQKQLSYLDTIPYTVRTEPVKVTGRFQGKVKLYNVWLDGKDGKLNVNGQLATPVDTHPGSLPIIATFNGASILGAKASLSQTHAYQALVFDMSLHDIPPVFPSEDVPKYREQVNSYQYKHSDNPEKFAMRDIFLRVFRSLEYLKTLPEWDGKHLIARGGSLGGCQSIVAAALDKDVTFCAPAASAMCDHTGFLAQQSSGWPQLLERCPEAIKVAPYFDAANFATRVKCPVRMAVGFIDTTCPPTSTYAAFNNVPGDNRKMYHSIGGDHGGRSLRENEPGVYSLVGPDVAAYIRNARKEAN